MKVKIAELDIIYLSYDEPKRRRKLCPIVYKSSLGKRVHGAQEPDAAHKVRARLTKQIDLLQLMVITLIQTRIY